MNVSLPGELDHYVRESVASGRYTSASEVIREALRLLQQIERSREVRQARADAKLRELQMEVVDSLFAKDCDHKPRPGRRKRRSP